jgi:hypothetical protein
VSAPRDELRLVILREPPRQQPAHCQRIDRLPRRGVMPSNWNSIGRMRPTMLPMPH